MRDGVERRRFVPCLLCLPPLAREVLLRIRKFEVEFPLFFGSCARRKTSWVDWWGIRELELGLSRAETARRLFCSQRHSRARPRPQRSAATTAVARAFTADIRTSNASIELSAAFRQRDWVIGFECYAFGVLNRCCFGGREEHSGREERRKGVPARELLFVARGCTGNPENSNSPRGFSTLLFDAAGMPGTSCALLAQAGSRLELFRGTGRAASRGSRESEALEERERDQGWILRHAPHSIFPSPISSAFSRKSFPRLFYCSPITATPNAARLPPSTTGSTKSATRQRTTPSSTSPRSQRGILARK